MMTESKERSAWISYVLPMFAFLLLTEISARVSSGYDFPMLLVRVVVPCGLLAFFFTRGCYPELKFHFSKWSLVDVSFGGVLAGLWITPYLLFPSIRPEIDEAVFDPSMAGPSMIGLVLSIRMMGFALVTPVMEELFMRSFLMRSVDTFDVDKDFRSVAIGTFSWKSFLVVVGVFLATHVIWEWWVMLPWAVLTNLWFYYRKDLFAVIMVHAATNGAILFSAIFLNHAFSDGAGGTLPLWFFV